MSRQSALGARLLIFKSSFYPRHDLIVFDEITLRGLQLALLHFPNKPSVVIQESINRFLDNLSCVLPSAGSHLP
ncbi:MAG TPA: hypothetical protein VF938_13505 [Candidatus Angelobacter sp.]